MCVADPTKFLQGIIDISDSDSLSLIIGKPPLFVLLLLLLRVHGGVLCALSLVGLDSRPFALGPTLARVTAARLHVIQIILEVVELPLAEMLSCYTRIYV